MSWTHYDPCWKCGGHKIMADHAPETPPTATPSITTPDGITFEIIWEPDDEIGGYATVNRQAS